MKDLIWTKDNVLTKEFCSHLIEKFENDDRKSPGKTISNKMIDISNQDDFCSEVKKSTDLCISFHDEWKKEDKVFYDSLNSCLVEYNQYISDLNYSTNSFTFAENLFDSGYQIQRTKPGEYYHWHDDFFMRFDYFRVFTYIWYLNDVYGDGYTEFIDGTIIKPRTGKILIFPATWTYLHRGVSPTFETKYICTGWMQRRVSS